MLQFNIASRVPSSGLSAIQVQFSDTVGASLDTRRVAFAQAVTIGTIFVAATSVAGPQSFLVRPMGRFANVLATNADAANAQGASATVTLAAYPA